MNTHTRIKKFLDRMLLRCLIQGKLEESERKKKMEINVSVKQDNLQRKETRHLLMLPSSKRNQKRFFFLFFFVLGDSLSRFEFFSFSLSTVSGFECLSHSIVFTAIFLCKLYVLISFGLFITMEGRGRKKCASQWGWVWIWCGRDYGIWWCIHCLISATWFLMWLLWIEAIIFTSILIHMDVFP